MDSTPNIASDELPSIQLLEHLLAERNRLSSEREHFRKLYLDALEIIRKLELGLVGKGRERVANDRQLALALIEQLLGQTPAPAPDESSATDSSADGGDPPGRPAKHKSSGRKPLPENLPRVDIRLVPPEVEEKGTDAFELIGEDTTETVERRRAAMVVVRVHRLKFKPKNPMPGPTVMQAPAPELPIQRSIAGPGLLAHTLVHRFADHLPLHRLERIYGREGFEIPRQRICDWHFDLAALVQPLIDAMWKDSFASPWLCVDATGVLVQAQEQCRRAHFFVVASPERHVLFGYSPKHNNAAVDELLSGYSGYLVADAHSVYDHLYLDGKIREAGCWAHVRRYFFKSIGSEPVRAKEAIDLIGQLFHVERLAAALPPDKRLGFRKEKSAPVLQAFWKWCAREALSTLDETPLHKAISYATNHRTALERFLENGQIPIHNNWSERELRRQALGRKNWLFVGSARLIHRWHVEFH